MGEHVVARGCTGAHCMRRAVNMRAIDQALQVGPSESRALADGGALRADTQARPYELISIRSVSADTLA